MTISVNKEAYKVLKDLLDEPERYKVKIKKLPSGATVVDTGIAVKGCLEAGLKIVEIVMGGLGRASITNLDFDGLVLPVVNVYTDWPAVSLLGCQLAGWGIKVGDFSAMASGPGRALSLKPKKVFEKIGYKDESDIAILLLETEKYPDDNVALEISKKCGVNPENLYLILTTTVSIAGSVQVSGRIVETGLYRLDYLGFDPKKAICGSGFAPIMPIHPDSGVTLAREEDALIYGGATFFAVEYDNDEELEKLMDKTPATVSKDYGRTSYEVLKEVNFDWSKLDPAFFAPGYISVTNVKTGKTFSRGKINSEVIKKSLGVE